MLKGRSETVGLGPRFKVLHFGPAPGDAGDAGPQATPGVMSCQEKCMLRLALALDVTVVP